METRRAFRRGSQLLIFLATFSAHGVRTAGGPDYTVTNLSLGGSSWLVPSQRFNALNQIAGSSYIAGSSAQHAFFHDGTTLHDLGTLGGYNSEASDFSDAGQVVGYADVTGFVRHAFSWTQAGGMVDLGTLGGTHSVAIDVNNAGQVVGYAYLPGDTEYHAFLWTQTGGMVDLGTPGSNSEALSLNEAGQVVGWSYNPTTNSGQAFSWTHAGGRVDLGTFGVTYSIAQYVTDAGQVIGFASTAGDAGFHAFSWTQAGGMVDLGTLGGSDSYPNGVNSAGQVIGWSFTASDVGSHAFSWTRAGGMTDLGTFGGSYSSADFVNDVGHVVGSAWTAGDVGRHPFLWTQASGMVDLGTLGGALAFAYGVNNAGQVVGCSDLPGNPAPFLGTHAFSWTQAGGIIDLNNRIGSTAPPGMELYCAYAVSNSGAIVASTSNSLVLLGSSSTAPVLGPISANDPIAVGASLDVSANFSDVDTTQTHTAVWTWGDGTPGRRGVVSESNGSGMTSASHVFSAAGVYTVTLKVSDSVGLMAQVRRDVVVYDPSAGFVTGGGWINSPPGAYKEDERLVGRATFGFVSKYKKGATIPSGKTEFQFSTAHLNFHSNNYQWLVVSGARAHYKGTGTINGSGSYSFMLTAVDGHMNGGGGVDRFRIKIWYHDAALEQDVLVYDNQVDTATEGTLSEGTAIGGGSIVIVK